MQYANGARPYILEWYHEVFLPAYNSKTEPDSKQNSIGETLTDNIIAVTSADLIDKTFYIYKKKLSTKQILQVYINPLVNENYIDFTTSEVDKRAHIYYPVLSVTQPSTTTTTTTTTTKYSKLFNFGERNNISQNSKITGKNSTLYPDKQYINSKIQQVLRYSSHYDLILEIKNHEVRK